MTPPSDVSNFSGLTRRRFLGSLAGAGAAAAAGVGAWLGLGATTGPGRAEEKRPLPVRPLGRTGVEVTIVGLGGWHLGVPSERDAIALATEAVDAGILFLDNAADYHGGASEERMGKALAAGGRRDRVFLMTKCCDHARTRAGSIRSLEESLKRLRTDRLDLWQLHDLSAPTDPERIFAKGGALEAVEEAKKRGLIRFAGFTGHSDPAIFVEALAKGYAWDTVQMPLNPADPHHRSFERTVLPLLAERKIAAIGMKSLASGTLPASGAVSAEDCIRYALSLPTATVVCGVQSRRDLDQCLGVARGFTPLDAEARAALSGRVAARAAGGRLEGYKRA